MRETRPLCTVTRRVPPTPEVCELTCGHRHTHKLYESCRSARHYCGECSPLRGATMTSSSAVYSGDRLVQVIGEPDNVVQFVPRNSA